MFIKSNKMSKIIVLIVGVAGSGKTMLGHELARMIKNGVFISKDFIQDAFTTTERAGETYENIRGPTFELLINFAKLQLQHGKLPIIDAPFSRNHNLTDQYRDWITPFKNVAGELSATLMIIRCIPPNNDELKSRLKTRGNEYDKQKLNNFEAFLQHEPINFPISHDNVIELVTDKSPETLARSLIKKHFSKLYF